MYHELRISKQITKIIMKHHERGMSRKFFFYTLRQFYVSESCTVKHIALMLLIIMMFIDLLGKVFNLFIKIQENISTFNRI